MSFIQKYLVNIIYAVKVLANVDARVKFDSVAEHGHQYLYKAMHSDISRAQVSPPPSAAPRPIASGPSRGHPRCMPPHSYRLSPRESPLVLVQFTPKSKKITRISVLGIVVLSFDVGVIPNGGRGGLLIAIPCLATHRLYCIRSRIVVGDSRFRCFVTIFPDILNSLSTPAPVAGTAMVIVPSRLICM